MVHSVYGIWGDLEISRNLKKLCTEMYAAFFIAMKPFKDYDEQIKILQDRGLLPIITDTSLTNSELVDSNGCISISRIPFHMPKLYYNHMATTTLLTSTINHSYIMILTIKIWIFLNL